MYFIQPPFWLQRYLYPQLLWRHQPAQPTLYLTFDDGPIPDITPWVLEQLAAYQAKATFFCIGNNIQRHPHIYQQIIEQQHTVANHTYHHLNGWQTPDARYLDDIAACDQWVQSPLFRPPYGRISRRQIQQILQQKAIPNIQQIVMWDVLSADFDTRISPQQCWQHVQRRTRNGSIVVFHDSLKAAPRMQYALPRTLAYFAQQGYRFEGLPVI